MSRLQARLDAAELPVTAREFTSIYVVLIVVAIVLAFILQAPILILAGAIIGPAILWQRYESQRDKFRQAYDESLAEATQLLREGFSATGALPDALADTSYATVQTRQRRTFARRGTTGRQAQT